MHTTRGHLTPIACGEREKKLGGRGRGLCPAQHTHRLLGLVCLQQPNAEREAAFCLPAS